MQRDVSIAIIGATGIVGQAALELLPRLNIRVKSLRLVSSEKSRGTRIPFQGSEYSSCTLAQEVFSGIDYALFCSNSDISREWVPVATRAGCIVIDCSSYYRMDTNVPLIIPEINGETLVTHSGIIASPNCTATIALMALAPLHRAFGLKQFFAASYQAASGAGREGLQALENEIAGRPLETSPFGLPLHLNAIARVGTFTDSGETCEEIKLREESRKILDQPSLKVSATCVRIPTFRCHAVALHADFIRPCLIKEAVEVLESAPGIHLHAGSDFPTPLSAGSKLECHVGRIRKDALFDNGLALWVVGDQLYKGAAQNALEILLTLESLNARVQSL